MRILTTLCLVLLLIGIMSYGKSSAHSSGKAIVKSAPPPTPPDEAKKKRVLESYGKLPLSFTANQGQTDARVKFTSRVQGYNLFLTATEAVFQLPIADRGLQSKNHNALPATANNFPVTTNQSALRNPKSAILKMRLLGANPAPQTEGVDQLPGKSNYFSGSDPNQWHTNISTFAKVKYSGVYPGVDLLWYGDQRQLKYDLIVAPHTNPEVIQLAFEGAQKLRIDADGSLIVRVQGQELIHHKPVLYQEVAGVRKEIAGRYVLRGRNRVGFVVASYDASQPLVIDPVLIYSTYLGGKGNDEDTGAGIAVDNAGNVYVTGQTPSSDFPTVPSAPRTSNVGAYVTKLNSTGSVIIYSTILEQGYAYGIAVDSVGNAYITGNAEGNMKFPITENAFQKTTVGGGFVTKLNTKGDGLLYSTYLGYSSPGKGIAVDGRGNIYVTGSVSAVNFPTTPNAFQPLPAGGGVNTYDGDAYVAMFAPNMALLSDNFNKENNGQCATGYSSFANWAVSSGTVDLACTNGVYPNLAKQGALTSKTTFNLTPGTYHLEFDLAGSGNNQSGSITARLGTAFDESFTLASSAAFQTIKRDIKVSSQVNAALVFETTSGATTGLALDNISLVRTDYTLTYATYLGGANNENGRGANDSGTAIAVDSLGLVYVTGYTQSATFPTTVGAFKSTSGGGLCFGGVSYNCFDAFIAKLNPTATTGKATLIYSTYLGSSRTTENGNGAQGDDFGYGITVDSAGNAYVTGATQGFNFPTTLGPFQANGIGNGYTFVTKLNATGSALIYSDLIPSSLGPTAIALDASNNIYITGYASGTLPVTPDAFQSKSNGGADAFILKLNAAGNAVLYASYIGGGTPNPSAPNMFDWGQSIAVDSVGDAYIAGTTYSLDFPTRFPIQAKFGGGAADAFVAKFGFGGARDLTIAGVLPNKGGNSGQVTGTVIGTGFVNGTSVKLKCSGQADIPGENASSASLGSGFASSFTATFNLINAKPGTCDMVVSRPDGTSLTLNNSFTIQQGGTPQVWVDVVGRKQIRGGREQLYNIQFGNRGNIDAQRVLISVAVPKIMTLQADVRQQLIDTVETSKDIVLSFAIPSIPAGTSETIPLQIKAPDDPKLAHSRYLLRAQQINLEDSSAQISNSFARPSHSLPQQAVANATAKSGQFSTLFYNPDIFDSCNQPAYSCPACDPEWKIYNDKLQAALIAKAKYSNAKTLFAQNVFDVGLIITDGITASVILGASATTLTTALFGEGISSAGLGTATSSILNLLYGLTKFTGRPEEGVQALLNGEKSLAQSYAILSRISQDINGLKDAAAKAALLAKMNKFLSNLGIVETILSTLSSKWSELTMSWNDMNTARKLYIKASADLCNAVMIYQNCSNSKCGGSGTIKPDDEGDQAKLEFELVTSNDPNDKVGGHGIGDNRWLTDNEPLRSVIYFENKSTATADAQDVVITDQLDSNKVDLSTLQFGIATFDDKIITSQTSVNALAGSNEFNAQVDLRPARNLAVNINAAVNPNTGLLTWRFNTIDPATRKPPEIDGFLPPGKEGSISFTVMPKKDLPTGTVVRNKATIKFDFNDPIDTPEWFNTIDNTKPTSHVLTLNATQTTPNFAVKWAGQDDGAGVQDYTVYVAENGGAFAAWLANTTATEAVYAGQVGKSYSFYSIARDQVGYVESAKTTAETSTTVVELVAGYEGDVTPRPNGKNTGTVSITDWVQVGRFYAGLDTAGAGSEFQRADCAPKESKGDGKISLADWVQTGRFAIGLDPVVSTGGATIPSFALAGSGFNNALFRSLYSSQKAQSLTLNGVRTVQAVNTNFTRGKIGTMQIALDAQGNENAVAFSLQFDPKAMSFVEATAGDGANGAAVIVNSSQAANGRVGLAMMLPAGQQLAAGTRNLLNLRFIPNGGDGAVSTSISFSDQLLAREIVDALATPIAQVSYVGSTVNISGKAVATVSAANYVGGEQAAESIVSAFGLQLSSFTQAAPSLPLPISLGGSQVIVKDSKNVERFAPLFYASPGQINFQIPAGTAEGVATLTIFGGAGISQTGLVMIGKVVPAIFSADSTGVGLAAGSALTVRADGSRTENNLARYDVATSKFIAQPIDMGGSGDQVYLTLYGTGIKNRNDLANVKVKIGGIDAEVQYAGAQGFFAGLDQINVRVPQGLSGRGIVNIELIVEGKIGNIIMAAIR